MSDKTSKPSTKKYSLKQVENNFCPDCKGLLYPKKIKDISNKLLNQLFPDEDPIKEYVHYCNKCDLYTQLKQDLTTVKKVDEGLGRLIVEKSELPTISHHCEACGHDRAHIQQMPPAFGDEDDLRIYKCANPSCGKVTRDAADYGM